MSNQGPRSSTVALLLAGLAVFAMSCAAVQRGAARPEQTQTRAPALPAGVPHDASGHDRDIVVVRAQVDAYRKLVSDDDEHALLDTRVGILARQMSPELPRGTEVTAVYSVAGSRPFRVSSQLLALQVGRGAKAVRAFHVKDEAQGIDAFYRLDGRPVEKAFLRYPVNYMLITSHFARGRKHPILKSHRPHLGVDLAAPRGTPVIAVADGEVIEASWSGNYGRTVGLRHDRDYVTGYSHLERIAPEMTLGARVRKGQIIGYVGRTGLATGHHLHFSMVKNGSFVDPLTAQIPSSPSLQSQTLHILQASANEIVRTLVTAEARPKAPTRVASRSSRRD